MKTNLGEAKEYNHNQIQALPQAVIIQAIIVMTKLKIFSKICNLTKNKH